MFVISHLLTQGCPNPGVGNACVSVFLRWGLNCYACKKCMSEDASPIVLVNSRWYSRACEGDRQTRLCFVYKQNVCRTGKVLHQMELSGSEHHHRSVQQVRDDVLDSGVLSFELLVATKRRPSRGGSKRPSSFRKTAIAPCTRM